MSNIFLRRFRRKPPLAHFRFRLQRVEREDLLGPLLRPLDLVDGVDRVGVDGVEDPSDGGIGLRVPEVEAGPATSGCPLVAASITLLETLESLIATLTRARISKIKRTLS